jgi:TolB protein
VRYLRIVSLLILIPLLGTALLIRAETESEEPGGFVVISKAPSQVPIAVPDFLARQLDPSSREIPSALARILRADLEASGLFQVISPELYLQTPGVPERDKDFSAWSMIGAEACVRGILDRKSEERYQVELRFYDVSAKRMVLGKRYTGSVESLRRMIHRFADEILLWLTGKRGCFETRIAFVSDRSGRKEIYIMDSDGENIHPVTSNRTLNLGPVWLDPERILYTSYKKVQPQVYLRQIPGGQERQITSETRFNLGPAASPNGTKIALALENPGGNIDIYLMNPDGSNIYRITTSAAIDLSPAWSPDAMFLAFVSDRTGNPQIYLFNLHAGSEGPRNQPIRLSWEGDYNVSPAWAPDGRRVAFSGRRGGQFDLFLINLDQEGKRTITRLTDTAWNEEDPAWSPDGRMLIYSSNQKGDYDIYTISVFAEKTRRLTESPSHEGSPAWSPTLKREGP